VCWDSPALFLQKKQKKKCIDTDQGIRFVILSKLKPNKTVADVKLLDNNGVCEAEYPATITVIDNTAEGFSISVDASATTLCPGVQYFWTGDNDLNGTGSFTDIDTDFATGPVTFTAADCDSPLPTASSTTSRNGEVQVLIIKTIDGSQRGMLATASPLPISHQPHRNFQSRLLVISPSFNVCFRSKRFLCRLPK
jgi:hypothetical protein